MTKTSTAAAVTLEHIYRGENGDWSDRAAFLALIDQSKMELDALGAGMHGLTGEDRDRQNRAWSAQGAAQLEIVTAALKAGVPVDDITAITYRESW